MNRILILGNGFNADLGLKVGYEDFFQSSWYKNLYSLLKESPLLCYIDNNVKNGEYNIEAFLSSYIKQLNDVSKADSDRQALFKLEQAFSKFVDERNDDFDTSSCAFNVLRCHISMRDEEGQGEYWIFSFCYTLFDRIRKKISENDSLITDIENAVVGKVEKKPLGGIPMFIDYIHGRCSEGMSSAILGLSADELKNCNPDIIESYKFVLKENHPNYMICKKLYLQRSLEASDVITFFGFSFSDPDVPYVKEWLNKPKSFSGKRIINLYLYNEEDMERTINKIRGIAGSNWNDFSNHYIIVEHITNKQ